jgi:hypothetical protein
LIVQHTSEAELPNPYQLLPQAAFWRTAVGQRQPHQIEGLWTAKWPLSKQDKVATAGSCFAQHIGRALANAGYSWFDAEPAPAILPEATRRQFNYGIFSFRTGNIYTVALLRQWLSWAFGQATPSREVWMDRNRFYDPFRPSIEPEGFATESELFAAREVTLQALRQAVTTSSVFVFTLGLTEAWIDDSGGHVYPMCPGTVAGEFDPARHRFHNYRYDEIRRELELALDLMRAQNPQLRFLLTVSPVPLTATASSQHVLVATIQSKSTLRAVAGDMADARTDTDYFPSFEIVSSFPFRGRFYEDNMRTVTDAGVDFVMQSFFAGLNDSGPENTMKASEATTTDPLSMMPSADFDAKSDIVCEEELLEAFSKTTR